MALPTGKVIFSGIQPSGVIHLGNYLGALKPWVALAEHNTAYYCIVDLHAITVDYEPNELPSLILDAAALYLACGLDPSKSTIFVQSHVPAHTELTWLLSTVTPYGELTRMTQFKEKGATQAAVSAALFNYPILMAADILLYQTDIVPVGEDQRQHLELARMVAERFNRRFGEVFRIPEALITKPAARIISLTDPTAKMSKSDNANSFIALTDTPDVIREKIKAAVTETEPVFSFYTSGPAVKNLLMIYQGISGEQPEVIEQRFAGHGYEAFKEDLATVVSEALKPIREKFTALRRDEAALHEMLGAGAERAAAVAAKTLQAAKEKMGLG